MNRLLTIFCTLFAVSLLTVSGQELRFRAMTYNVENLYDTCHDEGFDDHEFLPDAERAWNTNRYRAKLSRLSRVIAAVGGANPVDIVALCEVENDTVVRDLCRFTKLRRLGYEYVITHSRDSRGIDVALLYQPMRFKHLADTAYVIPVDSAYGRPTRDILHVTGRLQSGDTLDVFVCHMPSRRGGNPEAERYRRRSTAYLRRCVDEVIARRTTPSVVIMGDFNDDYRDASIRRGLSAVPVPDDSGAVNPGELYVLTADLKADNGILGSYRYRGAWNQLDHVIVNGALLNGRARFRYKPETCRLFAPPFLCEEDKTYGGVHPRRTYLGPVYHGGYSDHFPVVADFELQIY